MSMRSRYRGIGQLPVVVWFALFSFAAQAFGLKVEPVKARRETGNYLDWLTREVGKALDDWQELGDTVEQLGDAADFAHLKFYDSWHKRNIHQTYLQFEAAR